MTSDLNDKDYTQSITQSIKHGQNIMIHNSVNKNIDKYILGHYDMVYDINKWNNKEPEMHHTYYTYATQIFANELCIKFDLELDSYRCCKFEDEVAKN